MASKSNLQGLGMSPFLASRIADCTDGSIIVTGVGASIASGYQVGGSQYLVVLNGSNTGFSATLPGLGGDNGALLGDEFTISNPGISSNGSATVYAQAGSTIYINGSTTSGSGGTVIASGHCAIFVPISASTWIGIPG